jgi:LysM repeat protein
MFTFARKSFVYFMKHLHVFRRLLVVSSLSLASYGLSAQSSDTIAYFLHTVEKGQSLYSISGMYGVGQADIVRLNPGAETKIYAGGQLKIPQSTQRAGDPTVFHTIQRGETLYRLTTHYGVTAKQIMDANPGLSADNFRAGEVVRIPAPAPVESPTVEPQQAVEEPTVLTVCREMHKIRRRETVKSISREYGITEEELLAANPEIVGKKKLKRGDFLCIPHPKPKEPIRKPSPPVSNERLFEQNESPTERIATVKAAVILPFLSDNKSESARMVEYYEGFLMAVDSLKTLGVSMDIYAYDSGKKTAPLTTILAKPELATMDVIFGAFYESHTEELAAFAEAHRIRLVVPFARGQEVYQNPYIYQINTPPSYVYSEVYDRFATLFPQANVIFVDAEAPGSEEETAFVNGFKEEMQRRGIPVQTVVGVATLDTVAPYLRADKENFFIPTSSSDGALTRIVPQLQILVRNIPDYKVRLFGYPKWQVYTNDFLDAFFELDTYFYSWFYTNNLLPSAQRFIDAYHRWYSKEMINVYPLYGMLGFDTAFFFLNGLYRYGTAFEEHLSKMSLASIQTGLKMERVNNWGGFINRKVFFVHFTPTYQVVKMDFE